MTVTETLNKTAGRFTTLIVNRGDTNTSYCARINSVGDKLVSFYDVNAHTNRRVRTEKIVFARSGGLQFRKSRTKKS